jgi:guanine deaminase
MRGTILTPTAAGSLRYWRDGALLSDGEGRILFVGSYAAARRRYAGPMHDVRPGLVMPGFVDAHTHYPQTRIIGRATGPLLTWLDTAVFPEEARFAAPSHARKVAEHFASRLVRCGTTTAAVFSSSHPRATDTLFRSLEQHGLRALVGLTLMDRRCPRALRLGSEEAMAAIRKLAKRWHGRHDRLRLAMTPRFALSCSRKILRHAGALARELSLPVQTHIAETRDEGAQTLIAHRYASDYLAVYEGAGLLGPRTILAHAIHVSGSEWRRIADSGAAVAHCPDSNFFLGSGRMHLGRVRKHGITVGLGSDVAAGRIFSLRRAMAHAYDNAMCARVTTTPEELFAMATMGGARALGWSDRIGSLEPGKDADIAVFELPRHIEGQSQILAHLLFDTDELEAKMSYVRGRRLQH